MPRQKRTENALEALQSQEPRTPFAIKRLLTRQNDVTIPPEVKKVLTQCTTKAHECTEEQMNLLQPVLKQVLEANAIKFMASALLYYNHHHALVYEAKYDHLILAASHGLRSLQRSMGGSPTTTPFETIKNLYDNYLCGLEDRFHYYQLSQQYTPQRKRPIRRKIRTK